MTVFLDVDCQVARHLVSALLMHRKRLAAEGLKLPPDLVELLNSCRKQASAGPSGPPHPDSAAASDAWLMAPTPAPRLISFADAATMLAVSPTTVKRLTKAGALPVFRVGTAPRLRVSDLDDFINQRADLGAAS